MSFIRRQNLFFEVGITGPLRFFFSFLHRRLYDFQRSRDSGKHEFRGTREIASKKQFSISASRFITSEITAVSCKYPLNTCVRKARNWFSNQLVITLDRSPSPRTRKMKNPERPSLRCRRQQ